jgi:hypothetical protein
MAEVIMARRNNGDVEFSCNGGTVGMPQEIVSGLQEWFKRGMPGGERPDGVTIINKDGYEGKLLIEWEGRHAQFEQFAMVQLSPEEVAQFQEI